MTREFVADKNVVLRGFGDQYMVVETFVESVIENLYGEELMICE